MSKEFEELVLKKLDNMELTFSTEIQKLDNRITTEVQKLDNRITAEAKTLDSKITTEIQTLNNKFTVFDYEINNKIDTLFDAIMVNTEKDTVHNQKIESLDEKVFNHDIRISNLENKVLTA